MVGDEDGDEGGDEIGDGDGDDDGDEVDHQQGQQGERGCHHLLPPECESEKLKKRENNFATATSTAPLLASESEKLIR